MTRKTAWLLRRKISHAMARREGELVLRGIVELDEGFSGGKRPGPESRGRRQPGKTLVAMAAEHTPRRPRPRPPERHRRRGRQEPERCGTRNDRPRQRRADRRLGRLRWPRGRRGYAHLPRDMSTGADVDQWLPFSHIVLANFKRWTLDIFHGVSPAHLQAYLDEYCYRRNRREQREDIFRRLLNRCVLYTGPAPYALLTAT